MSHGSLCFSVNPSITFFFGIEPGDQNTADEGPTIHQEAIAGLSDRSGHSQVGVPASEGRNSHSWIMEPQEVGEAFCDDRTRKTNARQ